jgi:hypothetical protein
MLQLLGKLIVGLLVLGLALMFWYVTIFVLLLILGLKLMEKGKKPAPDTHLWYDGTFAYVTYLPTGQVTGPFPSGAEAQDFVNGAGYMTDREGVYSIREP